MAAGPERQARGRALPPIIPLFPLSGSILLPRGQLPLNIFEPRYLRMVEDALGAGRLIGMIQPREADAGARPALFDIGCLGRITNFAETGDGRFLITLTGLSRFRVIAEREVATPYRQAEVAYDPFGADEETASAASVDRERLFSAMRSYLDAENLSADWEAASTAPTDSLVNSLATGCPFAPNEKQALLEAPDIASRADCLIALLRMGGGERAPDATLQ